MQTLVPRLRFIRVERVSTCRVVAAVLQPLQTFEQDLEDLAASARDVIVEVRKYSCGERESEKQINPD